MPRQTKVILRNGTYAEWVAANPVLNPGEPGFETDSNLIKIGDGYSTYVDTPTRDRLPYVADFGVRNFNSINGTTLSYPENYSNLSATNQTLTYSTLSRAMHLVPIELKSTYINIIEVYQGGSALSGRCMLAIYNSDEYGRPYQFYSDAFSLTTDFAGASSVTSVQASLSVGVSGLYWIGVCAFDTSAGSIYAYTGNDTYVHTNTSVGAPASTAHYSCYIVNLPYSSTSMNYTIQNSSKVFTLSNTAFNGANLSLSGSYSVYGGIAVGDDVYVYSDTDDSNYAFGTVTALGTPTTYTITVNFSGSSDWNGSITSTRNCIVKARDFIGNNGAQMAYPPDTLTTSHLLPSTGNAPLVRCSS